MEVKSHPREESITQLKNLLQKFRTFFPEHKDKKLYGILAAVDWSDDLKQQALREGLYVASIHDEVFELAETPPDFEPKLWWPLTLLARCCVHNSNSSKQLDY